jgi:hypothetical protein
LVRIIGEKRVRFRAKISRSGRKIHIIVPVLYHQDIEANNFLGQIVQVEVSELPLIPKGDEII